MNWIQVLVPPLLMVIGGIITWLIKSRAEELRSVEEKLRETRKDTYLQILDPYVTLFSDLTPKGQKQALKSLTSREYRQTAFELNLFGSDDVVRAHNQMLMYTFKSEKTGEINSKEIMRLWGALLLEIRKSLGNKDTELDELDMLRSMIKDIDSFV